MLIGSALGVVWKLNRGNSGANASNADGSGGDVTAAREDGGVEGGIGGGGEEDTSVLEVSDGSLRAAWVSVQRGDGGGSNGGECRPFESGVGVLREERRESSYFYQYLAVALPRVTT